MQVKRTRLSKFKHSTYQLVHFIATYVTRQNQFRGVNKRRDACQPEECYANKKSRQIVAAYVMTKI